MHACPNMCGRQIANEMFLCMLDASRCPDVQITAYGIAWDTKNVLAQQVAMQALLNSLKVN